jgi:hypothetical protein
MREGGVRSLISVKESQNLEMGACLAACPPLSLSLSAFTLNTLSYEVRASFAADRLPACLAPQYHQIFALPKERRSDLAEMPLWFWECLAVVPKAWRVEQGAGSRVCFGIPSVLVGRHGLRVAAIPMGANGLFSYLFQAHPSVISIIF